MEERRIDRGDFESLLRYLNVPGEFDRDLLYSSFSLAFESAGEIEKTSGVSVNLSLNPVQLALYMVHELGFYLKSHSETNQDELKEKEDFISFLASIALDKYFTNERLAHKMGSYASRYSPYISTINLYLNFILGMLGRYKKGEPERTLIIDVMVKGFQMAHCVSNLLESGYETEAFSTWRTLHENESILHILVKYREPVVTKYLKHMRYGLAFRGGIPS